MMCILCYMILYNFYFILHSFNATSLHTHRINRSDNKLNAVRTKSKSLAKEFSKVISLNLSILKIGIDVFYFRITRMRSYGQKTTFLSGHVTSSRLNRGKSSISR